MHLKELSKHFQMVPIDQIYGVGSSRCTCAITFDDGWRDNYDIAFPIIKNYQCPVCIFIATEDIQEGGQFWFFELQQMAQTAIRENKEKEFISYFNDILKNWEYNEIDNWSILELTYLLKEKPGDEINNLIANAISYLGFSRSDQKSLLDWKQIMEMGHHGVSFGSHGLTHNIFTKLNYQDKRANIENSLVMLNDMSINITPYISYPNGDWDRETILLAKGAGYEGGVTTCNGVNDESSNPYLLNRIGIHEGNSNNAYLLWFNIFIAWIGGRAKRGGCQSDGLDDHLTYPDSA